MSIVFLNVDGSAGATHLPWPSPQHRIMRLNFPFPSSTRFRVYLQKTKSCFTSHRNEKRQTKILAEINKFTLISEGNRMCLLIYYFWKCGSPCVQANMTPLLLWESGSLTHFFPLSFIYKVQNVPDWRGSDAIVYVSKHSGGSLGPEQWHHSGCVSTCSVDWMDFIPSLHLPSLMKTPKSGALEFFCSGENSMFVTSDFGATDINNCLLLRTFEYNLDIVMEEMTFLLHN